MTAFLFTSPVDLGSQVKERRRNETNQKTKEKSENKNDAITINYFIVHRQSIADDVAYLTIFVFLSVPVIVSMNVESDVSIVETWALINN